MQNDSSETVQLVSDFESEPSYWAVDRSVDIARFLDLVEKSPGKPIFAHGRRDVGKTSLFDYHVRNHLKISGDPRSVRLGQLSVSERTTIIFEDSTEVDDEVLKEPLILCVDQFHHLFDLATRDQLEFLDWLREELESDSCRTSVVFVLDDDEIGDWFK